MMSGGDPACDSSGVSSSQGRLPPTPSPLGADPRPPLRQVYPRTHCDSFWSEYNMKEHSESNHLLCTSKSNGSVAHFGNDLNMTANDPRNSSQGTEDPAVPATDQDSSSSSSRRPLMMLGAIFLLSLAAMGLVYLNFPKLDEDEYQYIKFPREIEDVQNLGRVLSRYKEKYFYIVLMAITVTYIFLQTFAIPGSISLSLLAGFLFPFHLALPLVCLCSGIGASNCYLLSSMITPDLVRKWAPERIATWQVQVDHHRDNLLNYILFLRITPFLPNWLINIASPVVNVPLWPFFLGTTLGVGPPSFVVIQAGTTLYKLTSTSEAFTWGYTGLLAVFALISILPIVFKRQLRQKLE